MNTKDLLTLFREKLVRDLFLDGERKKSSEERMARAVSEPMKAAVQRELGLWSDGVLQKRELLQHFDADWCWQTTRESVRPPGRQTPAPEARNKLAQGVSPG